VYVADLAKTGPSPTERDLYVTVDVGFIAECVSVLCLRGIGDRCAW
jgi:hypothetical protein